MTDPADTLEQAPATGVLSSLAATISPTALSRFQPTTLHRRLAGALIEHQPATLADLATKAEISSPELYRVLEDPAAAAWIVDNAAGVLKSGLAAVYSRIYQQAIQSPSSRWAELFLKRFDPEFRRRELGDSSGDTNTQINIFGSWTERELRAFIQSKTQKVLGAPNV